MHIVTVRYEGAERVGTLSPSGDIALPDDGGPLRFEDLLLDVDAGLTALRAATGVVSAGLLAPVPRPRNIVCIGRNYADHAAEGDSEAPAEPLIFMKHTGSVIGPGDEIRWDPGLTGQVDWEAELGVVIGRRAWQVPAERALEHVLGYTCLNDVSARDLQFADGQWVRAKSLATFCPMGPAVVTADEVPDPQALPIRCLVNGVVMQEASTKQMVHSVAAIIAHCSRAFPLLPGDVIATGTPSGVGVFRDPPILLKDGDEVVVEIDGVGRLTNRCATPPVSF
jgi:2-keto-4-pentenoate hydratase/2-oxohepta-3-ene-1,7-dioic acid hydratase in catechol pathway